MRRFFPFLLLGFGLGCFALGMLMLSMVMESGPVAAFMVPGTMLAGLGGWLLLRGRRLVLDQPNGAGDGGPAWLRYAPIVLFALYVAGMVLTR